MSAPLQLRAIVKHYRGGEEAVRAIDGVSLSISRGELVALYGPSGSGKTTLLMIAAALLRADSGEVRFDGRDVGSLSAREQARYRARDVGLVSQELHLMPGASALDNALMKLPAAGVTLRQARRRTLPWLERVGLAGLADRRPDELSMGERQRVTIARALAAEPRLLLADEPTGSLDSVRTREVLALLRELCDERAMPGLLVTHDPEALRFVDRALTLRDGTLADGPFGAELGGAPPASEKRAGGPVGDEKHAAGPVGDEKHAGGPVGDEKLASGPVGDETSSSTAALAGPEG